MLSRKVTSIYIHVHVLTLEMMGLKVTTEPLPGGVDCKLEITNVIMKTQKVAATDNRTA